MADIGNEVVIEVSALDKTQPTKDQLKASWQTFEKSFAPIDLKALNPINEAFLAQMKASLKTISKQALEIPVEADTVPFMEQLDAVLADLAMTTKADIPVEIADAMEYRAQMEALVAQVSGSVKAVVDVEVNDSGVAEIQQKTLAASQANMEMVGSQQKLQQALASGNEDQIAKARLELAAATREADQATGELEAAQVAAAAASGELAAGEEVATTASRGLGAAMGPLWMLMNVAQLAMFGFGSSSSSTASQVQDVSQQIIALGNATGQTAASMLGGNANIQGMAGDLMILGSSANQFASAYSGSISTATEYTNKFAKEQKDLKNQPVKFDDTSIRQLEHAIGEAATTAFTASRNVDQLTTAANSNHAGYLALTPELRKVVDQYNALSKIVPQSKSALDAMKASANQNQQALAALGYTMTTGQQQANNYGLGIQAAAKALADATSGATYLENATDKASITAGQGVQAWKQLQASVTSAGQAYNAAGVAVANAEHGVTTASQGVAAAVHSEQQAVLGVTTAQTAYTNAVYQETQAQAAVTAARATAERQLISLKLQATGAAASVDQANLSLAQATQAAANVGVNAGNAQSLADTPVDQINAGNMARIAAADALIQAQNQVASSQDASTQAQQALNTARAQGVDNNPQVLSAEHALAQAQAGVKTAADGVTNAEYAQQQSVQAVANADYGLQQAEQGVTQAEQARGQAATALTTATDAASRSTDQNTLIGAQNRQMLENIFNAYRDATGSEQIAAQATQAVGQQMGFTSDKISGVLNSLNGLNGTDTKFSITGTPSINAQQLDQVGQQLGLSWAQIHAQATGTLAPASGRQTAKAVGGPADGMVWVGEQGPELVKLAPGSSVMPHANSMLAAAQGYASGGAVGALGMNLPLAAQWGALDTVGQMWHAFGGPPVKLPPAGAVDFGGFGGGFGGGSVPAVPSSRAANYAIMQSVFSQFGWGSGQEWADAVTLEMMEAGFNNLAQNPTSTAFGMGQFLDSTWAGYGIAKTADPTLQSEAMARYLGARYHDPTNALAHERAFHWYGAGGPVGGDGVIGVGDYGPELIRVPGGSSVSPAANSHTAGAAPVQVELVLSTAPGANSAVATMIMQLVRGGHVQLVANGQRVKVG